jgi:hypothetical protein
MLRFLSGFMASLATASSALAQVDGTICTALLDHGIANVVAYSSETDFLDVVRDQYCSTSYDSMSSSKQASFGATIKQVPVSLTGSKATAREQHTEFCRNYQSVKVSGTESRYRSASIYDKAIDAWRDCVTLAARGTIIRPSITPEKRQVDFQVYSSLGQSVFSGVDVLNMECRMDGVVIGEQTNIPLTSDSKSIRCTRNSQPIQFASGTVTYFPEANVKIKTTTGDYRVDLYQMIDGPIKDRIEKIESQIAELNLSLNKTVDNLGVRRDGPSFSVLGPRVGGPTSHACPAGTFVSVIQASASVTGRYGVDGIKQITFTCSPVKP